MDPGTLDVLAAACGVSADSRVLDVGAGKAALLRRWAVSRGAQGTGLEVNPAFVAQGGERALVDGVDELVTMIEGPADTFQPPDADPEIAELPGLSGVRDRLASLGLDVTAMIGSSPSDWDRYVSAWWTAAHDWAEANPAHPERAELLAGIAADRDHCLGWERDHVGWAVWVAREGAPGLR